MFPALKQNRGIQQLTNYCDAPKIVTRFALTQARHPSTGNRNARLRVRKIPHFDRGLYGEVLA